MTIIYAVGLLQPTTTTESIAEATSASPKTAPVATQTKSPSRMNGLMALGMTMLPTVALSLPMIAPFFGRKRRATTSESLSNWVPPVGLTEGDDLLVQHFTEENQEEMRRKDISTWQCRQLVYSTEQASPVLVCPGETNPTLNMIRLLN